MVRVNQILEAGGKLGGSGSEDNKAEQGKHMQKQE